MAINDYTVLFGVENEAQVTLTDPGDAGSTSWDARDGQVALVTLTSAAPSETRTIANPTNLVSGRRYSLTLIGAGTDPIAVTLGSVYVDSQNNRYQDNALTLYPGRTKTIEFQYDGTALRSTSQTERIVRVETAGAFVSTADNVGAYTSVDMNADGVTLSLPHTTTHELTVGDEAVYFNRGAFTGRITTPSGSTLYGSDEFPPGARVTATYVGSNAWALGGSGVDNTTLADMMFPVTLNPNAGIGLVTRTASSWDAGVMRRVTDLDAATAVTFDVPLPTALSFASGDTFQVRLVVGADTANANAVMAIGYSDDGGNFASEYIEIGTGGVAVVAGGSDTGNVTGVSTVKTFDRGGRKAYEINLVITWTGASGANPVLRLIPAYNLDGTAVADVTATNSLDIESIELGAVSEFTPAGGLTKQGTVTSDADAGEGIYTLDASAAAFDFTLPAATGTQSRYMFIGGDVATNAATIKVQAGETMNTTTDGTFTMNSNGEILLAVDRATGQWDVQVVGASSSTSLHYASREASLNSFAGVDTVITFDTDLDDTGAMITDTSVITIQQDGKYAITFDVSGDMDEATSNDRFIYVVKNVASPANDAAASAAAILTDHVYVDGTTAGIVQWSGGGVFDLVAGDTLVLYFAAASSNDVIRMAHFNVQQLPADEVVLAGMVTPTPLHRARMTQTVAQTNLASADTQIVFDTTTYDIGGMADPTNNQLVVQEDGYYQITANVTGDLGTSTQSLYVKILVNGGVVASSVSGSSASTPQGPTAVTTALLTAGDLITVVTQRPGGSGTVASLPGTTAGTGVYLEATQLPTSTVVDPGLITPTPLYNARYSLTADASGIVCPFDEGQGDTSVITNAGGVITLPAGRYRIEAFATRAGAVLDYDLYDATHSTVLEHYVVFGTGVDSSGSTMPYYLTVSAPTQIQIQETGSSASVVWNGRETNNDADATAQPSYGCYIDIQQLPTSTVVDPGLITPTTLSHGSAVMATQNTTSGSYVDVTGGDFVMANAGTYLLSYGGHISGNTNGLQYYVRIVDSAGTEVPGSVMGGTEQATFEGEYPSISVQVTLAAAETYRLQWRLVTGGTISMLANEFSLNWAQLANSSITAYTPGSVEATALQVASISTAVNAVVAVVGTTIGSGYFAVDLDDANLTSFDESSLIDVVNNCFTIQQAGRYEILFNSGGDPSSGTRQLRIDGAAVQETTSAVSDAHALTWVGNLTVGQQIEFARGSNASFYPISGYVKQLPDLEVVAPGSVPVDDVRVLLDTQTIGSGGTLTLPADLSAYEQVVFEAQSLNSHSFSQAVNASTVSSQTIYLFSDGSSTVFFNTDGAGTTATLNLAGAFAAASSVFNVYGVKAQKTVINTVDTPVHGSYADDVAAATGGVPVGGLYLNTTTGFGHTRMS